MRSKIGLFAKPFKESSLYKCVIEAMAIYFNLRNREYISRQSKNNFFCICVSDTNKPPSFEGWFITMKIVVLY